MPDRGVSATLPPALSHTSTQQWQSFEIRMRYRRAERCVLRAEVALEAGFEEDARAYLDEARHLNSQSPDFDALRSAVYARLAANEAARRAAQRRRTAKYAAAVLLVVTVGVGAFWVQRDTPGSVAAGAAETPVAAVQPSEPQPPAVTVTETQVATSVTGEIAQQAGSAPPIPPVVQADAKVLAGAADPKTAARPVPESQRAEPAVLREPLTSRPSPASAPVAGLASGVPEFLPASGLPTGLSGVDIPGSVVTPPAPAPPLSSPPAPTSAATSPSSTVAAERVAESPAPAVRPVENREAPPADPVIAEEPRVRAALARYEAAYSALNASQAQAVWPGVDQRSLARAFESLESQRVALGRCSVAVQGKTAEATCNGSVTWTPKVGGGTQTATRQWRFELASAGSGWQIVRAEAR